MCGIIGYTGKNRAVPYLLEGLASLEYRGYDSAGIALSEHGRITVTKTKGRISVLESLIASKKPVGALCGIGHTRWATHGEASDINAHPHLSRNGSFAVVHNGIIENHAELKRELIKKGFSFSSQTDTEVIAHLFESLYKGNLLVVAAEVRKKLRGAYAICVLCSDHPDKILCMRYGSPLAVGKGSDGFFVASDATALSAFAQSIYKPDTDETVILSKESIAFYRKDMSAFTPSMVPVSKHTKAHREGFEHYMLKEIYEQPAAVSDTLSAFIKDGEIRFPDLRGDYTDFSRIHIIGCGSAYHAALSGKYILEELCRIPVLTETAGEFCNRNVPLSEKDLCIVISQSGETADSLSAIRAAKARQCTVLSVVNVRGSTAADLSDSVIYTSAGPEIAVATTKAYLCQLTVLTLFAIYLADKRGLLSKERKQEYLSVLTALPPLIKRTVERSAPKARQLSELFAEKEHAFFIGRGTDYPIALESALKLKEISYIHAEAYPAGELKHGTISLIEPGTTVVALLCDRAMLTKSLNSIREVKARGARVIALSTEDNRNLLKESDRLLLIPHCHRLVSHILGVIPMQLLSYYTAVCRKCDVDKPRNLAKSVTVE